MSPLFFAIIVMGGYTLIVYVLAYFAYRRFGKTAEGWGVAGRSLGPFTVAMTMVGFYFGPMAITAGGEYAYIHGYFYWHFVSAVPVLLMLMLFVVWFVVGNKIQTANQIFLLLYEKKAWVINTITRIVQLHNFALWFHMCASTLGPLFGIDYYPALVISFVIIIGYTMLGGLAGVAWANIAHMIIGYCCMIPVAIAAFVMAGGFEGIAAVAPSSTYMSPFPATIPIAFLVTMIWGNLFRGPTDQTAIIGAAGAKSIKHARLGYLLAIPITFITFTGVIIGTSAVVFFPHGTIPTASAIGAMVAKLGEKWTLWPIIGSIGFWAAAVSTVPSGILGFSLIWSRDVFKYFKPDATDKQVLLVSRLSCVIVPIIGMAIFLPFIKVMIELSTYFMGALIAGVPAFYFAWAYPKINKNVCWISQLFCLLYTYITFPIAWLVPNMYDVFVTGWFHPTYICAAFSIIVCIIGCFFPRDVPISPDIISYKVVTERDKSEYLSEKTKVL